MPVYEYEHNGKACVAGKVFEIRQSVTEDPLNKCPECGGSVRKILSLTSVNTPKGNSDLRNLGFSKLVKRDDGVYENVTARKGESKYMKRGQPETMPNFKKTIRD